MKDILNIVDENDEIIGQETREKIHSDGLLHREVHVYFVTPNKEIIFQHRAKDKDTFPDLLDATVGGHVEMGDSYEKTAVKEAEEETGLKIKASDLIFAGKIKNRSEDRITGKINYAFLAVYLYVYTGDVSELKIEAGKALGFEVWAISDLLALDDNSKARFIPGVLALVTTRLAEFIKNIKIR